MTIGESSDESDEKIKMKKKKKKNVKRRHIKADRGR
jgi:hypothetical protein